MTRLVSSLQNKAELRADTGASAIPLSRAACGIGGGAKPWGSIFNALLEGKLKYWIAEVAEKGTVPGARVKATLLVDRIRVELAEFMHIGFSADRDIEMGMPHADWCMNRRDAEEVLNLTPANIGKVIRAELRSAVLPNGHLCGSAVLELARLRIAPAEISVRSASNTRFLPYGIRRAGIQKMGPSGWPRSAVEAVLAHARRAEDAPALVTVTPIQCQSRSKLCLRRRNLRLTPLTPS